MPAVKASERPTIDGDISDAVWASAPKASGFVDRITGQPAPDDTAVWLLYDSENLYLAFHAFDSDPSSITARETRRDAQMWSGEDTFSLVLDTFHTHRWEDLSVFTVNAIGTQSSRIGGGRAGKVEWKGDWQAAVRRVSDGWTGEMCVPWGILNYPHANGPTVLGLNFERRQERTKIWSMWSNIGPRFQQELMGHWEGVELPVRRFKPSVSLLPYVSTGINPGKGFSFVNGLDARMAITPELVGVATVNPDFANVEGAVEDISFSRSERFVPDMRPFFLEGGEVFNVEMGRSIGQFFHSRRIPQFDIGTKLYGKLGLRNTVGLLLTHDFSRRTDFVVRYRRDFSEVSNSNLMLVHVDSDVDGSNTVLANTQRFRWGDWRFDTVAAGNVGRAENGTAGSVRFGYEGRTTEVNLRYSFVAPDFFAADGYIPFTDFRGPEVFLGYRNEWREGRLRRANIRAGGNWHKHYDDRLFRRTGFLEGELETRSDMQFNFGLDGGTFEGQRDLVGMLGFKVNVSNRFRSWGVQVSFGKRADHSIIYITPTASFRVFGHLDIVINSAVLRHVENHYQHIITFNWEIDKARSIGGRVVATDGGTNFFISFRRSGYAGTDTYLIFGDPNAERFTKRFITKLVWPI
jgi:hypothetical protein